MTKVYNDSTSILGLVSAYDLMEMSLDPNRYNIIQIEECKDGYLVEYVVQKELPENE